MEPTVLFSGVSPLNLSRKGVYPHYAPTPVNHGYREVTSCHYSLREEVVNRLGSKQVVCSQWYMKLSGDSRRRTAILRDAPDEH